MKRSLRELHKILEQKDDGHLQRKLDRETVSDQFSSRLIASEATIGLYLYSTKFLYLCGLDSYGGAREEPRMHISFHLINAVDKNGSITTFSAFCLHLLLCIVPTCSTSPAYDLFLSSQQRFSKICRCNFFRHL